MGEHWLQSDSTTLRAIGTIPVIEWVICAHRLGKFSSGMAMILIIYDADQHSVLHKCKRQTASMLTFTVRTSVQHACILFTSTTMACYVTVFMSVMTYVHEHAHVTCACM